MPVLPLIDLLILLGWTSLAAGALLKAVAISTVYRPTILTFSSICHGLLADHRVTRWNDGPRIVQKSGKFKSARETISARGPSTVSHRRVVRRRGDLRATS